MKKISVILCAAALFLALPLSAFAQVPIGQPYNSPVTTLTDVGTLTTRVASNLYLLAGIVSFALFMWGGFEYIRGAGSDDRDAIGRGKRIIYWAILGFLIIFSSYWIIQIVEIITGFKIF